jgi:hypothetical protein
VVGRTKRSKKERQDEEESEIERLERQTGVSGQMENESQYDLMMETTWRKRNKHTERERNGWRK